MTSVDLYMAFIHCMFSGYLLVYKLNGKMLVIYIDLVVNNTIVFQYDIISKDLRGVWSFGVKP